MATARWPPRLEPAKSHDWRPRAIPRSHCAHIGQNVVIQYPWHFRKTSTRAGQGSGKAVTTHWWQPFVELHRSQGEQPDRWLCRWFMGPRLKNADFPLLKVKRPCCSAEEGVRLKGKQ
jgi:hypothetical protein